MNLIEVAFLPQEVREKFTSDFRIIAEYFYAKRTKTEKEFFEGPEGKRKIKHVKELLEFFRIFSGDMRYDAVVQNYQSHHKEGEMEMSCSLLDYIENKGISEGLSQGFQALIETCRELGQDYDSTMKRLTDKFSLTQEQAKEAMDKYWRF